MVVRGGFALNEHIWNPTKCPSYRGGLTSGVAFMRGSIVLVSAISTYHIIQLDRPLPSNLLSCGLGRVYIVDAGKRSLHYG